MAKNKCYNSLSCVLSVVVIVFILGAVLIDILFTKPEMRHTIEDIRVEVKDIHRKIDIQSEMIQHNANVFDSIAVIEDTIINVNLRN